MVAVVVGCCWFIGAFVAVVLVGGGCSCSVVAMVFVVAVIMVELQTTNQKGNYQ